MTKSVLDDIPGLGPDPPEAAASRSWAASTAVKQASLEELQALPWLPDAVAEAVYEKIHGAGAVRRSTRDDDLWEAHAGWWQDGFTDGADPEYEEQILPLAAEHLAGAAPGARRRHGRGPGRPAGARPAAPQRVVGVDPTWAQIAEAPARGGGPAYARAGGRRRCRSPTRRFDAVVACLVFEHIDDVDDAIAEVGPVLRPGGRFLFFLNHPLLQTPGSGWIDDQILDPPEQYWRIGPYLVEDESIEEVEKGVLIPFVHRPLCRYVNALAAAGLHRRPHGGAGAAAGLPRPGRRVRRRRHHPPAAVPA